MPAPIITTTSQKLEGDPTATSITVATPSGVIAGDVLIALIATVGLSTVTDPTGHWTQVAVSSNTSNTQRMTAFKRIATGAENATYTYTWATGARANAIIARISGAADVDVTAAGSTSQTGTTLTWPGVTTTGANDLLLLCSMRRTTGTITPPAGVTLAVTAAQGPVTSYIHQTTQAAAGASTFGTGTWPSASAYTTLTVAVLSADDTTPPSVPTGLAVTAITDRSVSLSWDAVTSPDLDRYRVYRDGSLVSTQLGTTVTVGDLAASTSYVWQVAAFDLVGNESAQSAGVSGSTTAAAAHARGLGYSGTIFETTLPAPFISLGAPGSWNSYQNREHGNAVVDPADPDANRRYKFTWTGLAGPGGTCTVGIAFSGDGLTWTQHPANPIMSGIAATTRGEDPYIAKHIADGTAYRDASGRLLMFCEEKPSGSDSQRGVMLFRSADHGITWTSYGRVLDFNATAGAWDCSDRTSPTVFHDGTRLVMFYEGRNYSGVGTQQDGMVGVAYSTDDGLTWSIGNGGAPVIDTTVNVSPWAQGGVVCDEIVLIGGAYYLLCHGQAVGAGGPFAFNHIGRWKCINLDPSTWTPADFIEIPGNPYDTNSGTEMLVGNDGARIVTERSRHDLYLTTLDGIAPIFTGWGVPL